MGRGSNVSVPAALNYVGARIYPASDYPRRAQTPSRFAVQGQRFDSTFSLRQIDRAERREPVNCLSGVVVDAIKCSTTA